MATVKVKLSDIELAKLVKENNLEVKENENSNYYFNKNYSIEILESFMDFARTKKDIFATDCTLELLKLKAA